MSVATAKLSLEASDVQTDEDCEELVSVLALARSTTQLTFSQSLNYYVEKINFLIIACSCFICCPSKPKQNTNQLSVAIASAFK